MGVDDEAVFIEKKMEYIISQRAQNVHIYYETGTILNYLIYYLFANIYHSMVNLPEQSSQPSETHRL